MNTPTYQQQERLIHEAYIENRIRPFKANFCFCGTLSPDANWSGMIKRRDDISYNYSVNEYGRMEKALFSAFPSVWQVIPGVLNYEGMPEDYEKHKDYEEWLFNGMVAALEALKQIHIEKGETIQSTPSFEKRKLTHI